MERRLFIIGTSIDPHIDKVIDFLGADIKVSRFDIDHYPKLSSITFNFHENRIYFGNEEVNVGDLIWYRRIGKISLGEIDVKYRNFAIDEAEHSISGILSSLEKYHPVFINRFRATRNASNKLYQYSVAQRVGLTLPPTIISNSAEHILEYTDNKAIGNFVAKTISKPLIYHDEIIQEFAFTNKLDRKFLLNHVGSIGITPVQLQQEIIPDFELRVTSVGRKHFAVKIQTVDTDDKIRDWRSETSECQYSWFELPDDIEIKLNTLYDELGIDFAASDFIVDVSGKYYFLESNPHGAWLWLEESLEDYRITSYFAEFLESKLLGESRLN